MDNHEVRTHWNENGKRLTVSLCFLACASVFCSQAHSVGKNGTSGGFFSSLLAVLIG